MAEGHSDAHLLIAALHRGAMLVAADVSGRHFQGLAVAGKALGLPSPWRRRCREWDAALGLSEKISRASVQAFLKQFREVAVLAAEEKVGHCKEPGLRQQSNEADVAAGLGGELGDDSPTEPLEDFSLDSSSENSCGHLASDVDGHSDRSLALQVRLPVARAPACGVATTTCSASASARQSWPTRRRRAPGPRLPAGAPVAACKKRADRRKSQLEAIRAAGAKQGPYVAELASSSPADRPAVLNRWRNELLAMGCPARFAEDYLMQGLEVAESVEVSAG